MLIINGTTQIQESGGIFERTYFMRGARRRCIEIRVNNTTYGELSAAFADGASIVRREDGREYDLTDFSVAGDIIDKRDGTFFVYMGAKTESEILEEQLAEVLLTVGGEA